MSSKAVSAWVQHHADLTLLSLARKLPARTGVWVVEQLLLQIPVQAAARAPPQVGPVLEILGTHSHSFTRTLVSLLEPIKNNLLSMYNVWHPNFSHTSFLLRTSPLPHKTKVLLAFCIGNASQANMHCPVCGASVHTMQNFQCSLFL